MKQITWGFTALAVLAAAPLAATLKSSSPLLTPHQQEVHALAISLGSEPAIAAARAAAEQRLIKTAAAASADGKATLKAALDEIQYGVLVAAAGNDPANPKVVWTENLPYATGTLSVPGARYGGDNPDRIYRSIAVDPAYRYEIKGQRNLRQPSLYFSFEAIKLPSLWGLSSASLQSTDIDIAKDGSFTITADATPANGRRNHLQLPPQTATILLRDTLADWQTQVPNALSVRRIDTVKAAVPGRDAVKRDAVEQFTATVDKTIEFLDQQVWKKPVNQLTAFKRDASWGVGGAVLAINRFSIKDDEALLITLDPLGGQYLGFQLTDPWLRSAPYDQRSTSLSNRQAKANADGSITYVLSLKDPGVHNWLDTGQLRDGIAVVRWELLPKNADASKAVREVRKLKLGELATALPASVARVTPAQRRQQLAARLSGYQLRVAQN